MERNTIQRKVILEGIASLCHATVDEIFDYSKKFIPNLSFSTVYRNLVVLEDDKLIRRIPNKRCKDIFESTCKPMHDHFVCTKCGRFIDYGNGKHHHKVVDKMGNLVIESTKISYGICEDCLKKEALK